MWVRAVRMVVAKTSDRVVSSALWRAAAVVTNRTAARTSSAFLAAVSGWKEVVSEV